MGSRRYGGYLPRTCGIADLKSVTMRLLATKITISIGLCSDSCMPLEEDTLLLALKGFIVVPLMIIKGLLEKGVFWERADTAFLKAL